MELLIFPIAMIALTWLLLVRPQKARLREREALVAALSVGDTVVTAGGMHGVVVSVDDETVTLMAAPDVELTFDKRAVGRIELDSTSTDEPDSTSIDHDDESDTDR